MTGIQEADAALWSDSERVTSERGDENVTHDEQGRRLHEDEGSAAVAADWTGIGREDHGTGGRRKARIEFSAVIRRKNRFRKRKLRDSFTRDGAVRNMPVSTPAKRNGTFSASGLAHSDHLRENEIPRGSRLKMRGSSCTHRNVKYREEREICRLRSDVPPAGDAGHGEGMSRRRDHGS